MTCPNRRVNQDAVRSVLVATDFSDAAGSAVRQAFALARIHGAHVTVVHVASRGASGEVLREADGGLRELTRGTRTRADGLVATGVPSTQISLAAAERGADLVVVGAHGAHWLRSVLLGSTAKAVVGASQLPVLLVKRQDSTEYSTVVLAVDASRRSFRAARRGMAVAPGARHVLVHGSAVLGENMLLLHGADDEALDELRDGQLAAVRPEIERLAGELTPSPDEVVVEPTRAQALISTLAALRDADLLVVGSERRWGLRQAFMGSVSRQAMENAPCDVLVVPLQRDP